VGVAVGGAGAGALASFAVAEGRDVSALDEGEGGLPRVAITYPAVPATASAAAPRASRNRRGGGRPSVGDVAALSIGAVSSLNGAGVSSRSMLVFASGN